MLYLFFMSTDAIAGMSGGTTIKYVDTTTTVDVSGYGNILGANLLESYRMEYSLIHTYCMSQQYFYLFQPSGGNLIIDYNSKFSIRVFYY